MLAISICVWTLALCNSRRCTGYVLAFSFRGLAGEHKPRTSCSPSRGSSGIFGWDASVFVGVLTLTV